MTSDLVPIKYWKPLPFTYNLMGKDAYEVTFDDIVNVQEEFVNKIRNEFNIPGIPDYYFLISHLLKSDPGKSSKQILSYIMRRDYDEVRNLFAG